MDASRDVLAGVRSPRPTRSGCGARASSRRCRRSRASSVGAAALTSAVDLVRGLGVLTDIAVVDVPGATAGYDNDYARAARRGARTRCATAPTSSSSTSKRPTRPATPATSTRRSRSLELWDAEILTDLVAELDAHGPVAHAAAARPRHAVAAQDAHVATPFPISSYDSEVAGPGGEYTERGVADAPVVRRPRADGAARRRDRVAASDERLIFARRRLASGDGCRLSMVGTLCGSPAARANASRQSRSLSQPIGIQPG